MTTARNAACWISKLYYDRKSEKISEIVLHTLLYFAQREALIAHSDSPLFQDSFEAWKYGPVMCEIRADFARIAGATANDLIALKENDSCAIREAIERYADIDPWGLVDLTHSETCWIEARKGCDADDRCSNKITVEAIRIDAEHMRDRRRMLAERRAMHDHRS